MMTSSLHHGAIAFRNVANSTNIPHDHDWPRFFRLIFISSVATFASIGNIFTISAIIVDDLLRKKGKELNLLPKFLFHPLGHFVFLNPPLTLSFLN